MNDEERVFSLSYDVSGVVDRQTRVAVVADTLAGLFPSEIVGWAELGVTGGARTTLLTRTGPERDTVTSLVAENAYRHPMGTHMQAHPTSVEAVRMSDLIALREWREHQIFAELFKPIGVRYQLAIPVPPHPTGKVQAWAMSRSTRDFSDRSVELAGRLQPLLSALNVLGTVRAQPSAAEGALLTEREHEVLELIAAGLTAQQIGYMLRISARTVNTHTEHLYAKLDVHDRVSAAAFLNSERRTRKGE